MHNNSIPVKRTTFAPGVTTQQLPIDPEATTTVSPEATSTTASPVETTTTVAPGVTTTTVAPVATTTVSPEATTTTVAPEVTTTVAPEATTTVAPVATSTTASPVETITTVAPGVTTTVSPEATTTTVAPVATTTVTPEATTTVSPETTTTIVAPVVTTTVVPVATTTVAPEATSTSASPVETITTVAPGVTTTVAPEVTTTVSPEATTTTVAPGVTTTVAPGVTTTIIAPVATTTVAPEATSTTASPVETITTVAPGVTTTVAPEATTTVAPVATTTGAPVGTTTVSPEATTTAVPDPCASNPCGQGSTCEARGNKGFVCFCLAGDNYNNKTHRCEKAKVFPVHIHLPDIVFENSMSDKASPAFKRTADRITKELDEIFSSDPTYVRSIVLKLWSAGNRLLRVEIATNASIEIIYSPNSAITASQVEQQMENATDCSNCSLAGAIFVEEDLCKRNPCDVFTTRCSSGDGNFKCTCMDGYIPSYNNRMCRVCPTGQKAKNSECVNCPFGYSGFNCNESWQLTLVIICSVFSALLLIAVILQPFVIRRWSKKKSKTDNTEFVGNVFVNQSAPKGPLINGHSVNSQGSVFDKGVASGLAAYTEGGIVRLPRAKVNNTWNSNTSLEMSESNSRQNLVPAGRN
ncbi:mucin-13-like [Mugil cephalus]|uniref:mucin-13-like n=1 Tax=Mugil cephalus TaxID=48193 RepID=UPI001FB6C5EF|nr:mucin-13-like [Mugil cephalus]